MTTSILPARDLLALDSGVRLLVARRDGTSYVGRLLGDPWLTASGAPGPGRVRMTVLDEKAHARAVAHFERADRARPQGTRLSVGARARREVRGTEVLAVLEGKRLRAGESATCPHCGTGRYGDGADRVYEFDGARYCSESCVVLAAGEAAL